MRKLLTAAILGLLALPVGAQTVSSTSTTVTLNGSGFAAGATVMGPQGACTPVSTVSTKIIASCPNAGTYTVKNPAAPTYPFALKALTADGSAPLATPMNFTWTVGAANPVAQTYLQADNSPCPASAASLCSWPGTTVASDSAWLVVTPASGTTAFKVTVSINTSGLAAGTFVGHITVTQPLFTTPTMTIQVNLTVTGAVVPSKVTLNWPASTVPAGGGAVTGYNVLRGASSAGPFTQIATTGASVLSYTDSTPPSGAVCYVVEGVNSGGPSTNSPSACVTVPGATGVKLATTRATKVLGWGLGLAALIGALGYLWTRRKSGVTKEPQ
jgi:hypothetical protein